MAVNAANLVNFGGGGSLAVGDWTYSAYPLSAPTYLPLNDDTASYLTSSYPALGAIYAPTTVSYLAATKAIPSSPVMWNMTYGNGIFMGWNATGNIITSADGNVWSSSGIDNTIFSYGTSFFVYGGWNNIAYGNGKFVAIRQAPDLSNNVAPYTQSFGATAVSYDNGVTWHQGTIRNTNKIFANGSQPITWTGISFINSVFVMTGFSNDNSSPAASSQKFWSSYSSDGLNWFDPVYYFVGQSGVLTGRSASGGGKTFALIRDIYQTGFTLGYYTTNNGASWTNTGYGGTPFLPADIAYGAGLFVIVGEQYNNTNTTTYWTSPDAITWTSRTFAVSQKWVSVTFANGYFMAVGQSTAGPTTTILTSANGTTWTSQVVPSASYRGIVAGGQGKFVYAYDMFPTVSATVVSLNTASANFTLPFVRQNPVGTQAYIKAT